MIDQKLLVQAVVAGIIWGVMFYFIRKGLNRRNFQVDDPDKKRMDFAYDAFFGGVAAAVTVIAKHYIDRNITPRFF